MKVGLEVRISLVSVLATGVRGELPPPKKEFFLQKLKSYFKYWPLFDNDINPDIKESVNAISANPEHYLFKIFLSSMPRTPYKAWQFF